MFGKALKFERIMVVAAVIDKQSNILENSWFQVSILSEYKVNRKAGRNHFHRYSDVIVHERRKKTKSYDKLLNQKSSLETSSGWRLYYISSQFDDLAQLEADLRESLVTCKNEIPSPLGNDGESEFDQGVGMDTSTVRSRDCNDSEDSQLQFLHELLHGNVLRCQHSIAQLQEAKESMFDLLQHRHKYTEIRRKRFELTNSSNSVDKKGPTWWINGDYTKFGVSLFFFCLNKETLT